MDRSRPTSNGRSGSNASSTSTRTKSLPREVRAPSGGTPPPATVTLEDGEVLHLAPIAHEISRRFQQEHPDEEARYGEAAYAWCVHDNQWLLGWAAEDL